MIVFSYSESNEKIFSFAAQVYPGFGFIPSGASRKLSACRGKITGM